MSIVVYLCVLLKNKDFRKEKREMELVMSKNLHVLKCSENDR